MGNVVSDESNDAFICLVESNMEAWVSNFIAQARNYLRIMS